MPNVKGEVFTVVSPKGFYTGVGPEVLSIKIHGLEEIKAKLRQLSTIGQTNAVREGLKAGANVIRDSIKAKAPMGKTETVTTGGLKFALGALKKSIVARLKTDKSDKYNIKYQVGPDRKIAFYGHMVEFGTSRHKIPDKPGKLLKFMRTSGGAYRPEFISEQTYKQAVGGKKLGGGVVFKKEVYVEAKRHPFVRPGFDSSKFRATEVIKERLLKAVDRIAKKESIAGDFT